MKPMKMNRKLLALIVALMVLTASLTAFSSAETEDEQPDARQEESGAAGEARPERGEAPEGRGRPAEEQAAATEPGLQTEAPEADAPETTAAPSSGVGSIEFDGTVVSGVSRVVTSSVGGAVDSVAVRAGQLVQAGDVLATLRTEKVYATQSGVVSAVFGQPGDSVSTVAGQYGAVLYIEPDAGRYAISADTTNAYSSSDNLYIHVGEAVYLKCYSDGTHTGVGFVSGVSGDSYTVEVSEGTFKVGETVTIFRSEDYASSSRIGRGTCERADDVAVGSGASGEGGSVSIAKMHVAAGDAVQKGDLLYETVSGSYDAYYCTGCDIVATASGILSQLNCAVGGNVSAGSVVAQIEPTGDLQLEIDVNEADLAYIHEGDAVTIRMNWDDGETEYEGIVFSISHMAQSGAEAQAGSNEAVYAAYISFSPDADVRIGMTAIAAVSVEE